MANNLHFEYSLSVNEKQTQQNLATFIKKTFGTDKNAKLSVPIKLDISTNLTNVDLKSIQDQLDKQFKGKLNLHATVKIDSSNVARQAQAELDRISKGLSLKVGLEIDPSAMKLMLGTVDVIKTLNKEVTKVKDNLKDLGKKIEININGAQINNMYEGALRTAEKIQKVNAQTTEEINEQLAITKEQLAHQKKLAEEKKKELDIEKEKQANNKKIEESNKNIRKQQQQLNKELKNVEAQIVAEKKKADVLDKQAKSAKSTAKVQEDATKKIEKSTEKIAELEKQRADNQAFLQSKREEEKALLTNIELNKQEITLLRTKIKEMEKLAKATVTVTKTTGTTKTTNTQAPKKPTAKTTSNKKVVQVDSAVVQATVQATNAVNDRIEAEDKVTKAVEEQAQAQAKSVQTQINNQDKLVQHTEDSAKKIEASVNKTYRAEDSKRKLRMPNGRDKIYNRIAESEFASSIAGYRIHDVTSLKEQKDYENTIYDIMVKSRGVLGTYNLELEEGVALTKEQLDYYKQILELLNSERVKALDYRGAKDKSDGKFTKAFSAWEKNKDDEKLGSDLDFQAEKESKIAVMRRYEKELGEEILKIEKAIGAQVRNNTESEKEALEIEIKRLQNDKKKKLNSARKDAMDEVKLYGKSKNAKVFEELIGGNSEEYDYALQKFENQIRDVGKQLNREFMDKSFPDLLFENIDQYFDDMEARIKEYSNALNSLEGDSKAKVENKIKSITKNMELIKGLINTYQLLDVEKAVVREAEIIDEEIEEKIGQRKQALENGALGKLADPSVVNVIKTNMENFKDYVKYTQAFRKHEHATRGEVDMLLVSFEKLKDATGATGEQWDDIAQKLGKMLGILGKTQEEIDEITASYREADIEAKKQEEAHQNNIKQGKEIAKVLNEQIKNLEKGSDLWNECKDAITAFNNAVKNNLDDEELDEYILKLHELSDAVMSTGKDSADFEESNSSIKIVRNRAKAEEDVAVKYEKQANALYQILKLKKEGKKVSFDINKLIDSEGRGWKSIAEEQEKSYRKMKAHMIDFEFQNVDMHTKFANGDTSNIFDPTSYMKYDEDAIKTTEDMIKVLSEFSAKAYLLAELQEKMKTHKPMQNSKANLDIANKTTQARIEEARAIDAVTAKQKEQQKNEQIHQEWLKNQEIAKAKEPYLKASKEIIKRIKGSTKYKNNKDDEKFMKSVQQTFMYIDNLKHSEATLQQTVDAFENLKTYAHETFNMKNETIKKLVEPFVKVEEAVTQTTQDMKKVESSTEEVAKDAQASNQATQEKVEADIKATQEIQEQAQAQNKLKENVEATAEATEKQVKAQKEMSAELRKQLTQIIPSEALSSIPSEMLDKMFEGVARAVDNGVKLTKTKFKDIIAVVDGLNQLDYSKALGERGRLVAQGRKKKDGVIYNRTDEYKAQKEAMDKQVEELEKPLLDILKMMEKELKGTTAKVTKEVKKSGEQQNKKENKTKAEQNKLAKQQETISSNIDKKQSNILQTAKDILLANKEGRQYILDINSLIDEQGRSWQDIAKNSEKVYKNVKDANILYTSFENMDMNRAYGNDAQSNGIFTPANYIDRDKYDKAKTDAERIALMSEYDGKFGILFSLEEAFKQLLEQENIQEEKMTNTQKTQLQIAQEILQARRANKEYLIDINSLVDSQGRTWKDIAKNEEKVYKRLSDNVLFGQFANDTMMHLTYNKGTKSLFDAGMYVNENEFQEARDRKSIEARMNEFNSKHQVLNELEKLVNSLDTGMMDLDILMEKYNEHSLDAEQRTKLITMLQAERITEEERLQKLIERTKNLDKESLEQQVKSAREKLDLTKQNAKAYNKVLKYANSQGWEQDARDTFTDAVTRTAMYTYNQAVPDKNEGADTVGVSNKQLGKELYEIREAHGILNELEGDLRTLEESTETIAKHKNNIANIDKILADLTGQQVAQQDKLEKVTDSITENKQKQVTVQQQMVKAQEDEANAEEKKKAKLQNMIRENKELMLQDGEIQSLEKEITLIDEKTKALKAQGETAKLYENLKMAGVKGKSADLMASNILVGELKGSDYGIEDLKKFKDEQVEIANLALSRADAQMRIDQNKELVEETIAYQRELDKLNGVVEENIEISDHLGESSVKELSNLKDKLKVEKEISETANDMSKNTSKVAEYEDNRTRVYNDTIQNYLNKAKELKESYVGDEELARMEEELSLLKEKIVLMQKQGETLKVLQTIADMADAGKGNFNDLILQGKMYPEKFGATDVEKFKQEQDEIQALQKKSGDLALEIINQKDTLKDSKSYMEMASDEQRRLKEYIKEKTQANEVDAVSLKQDKERVEVIKDLIVGLSDANRFIAGDGLNDLGLAKLEAMLQLYQGTDGLSHASFAGTGKDKKYFEHYRNNEEGLITDMATSVIPYELAKYHDLYPKLESWYKELAELAKLGDTPEYKALDKKVQSLFRTIVGTIEGIVYNLIDQPIAKVDLWDAEMIHKSADDYRKEYGMQTVDSSGMEGDKEATALESSVKASMRAITAAQKGWGEVKQEVQEVATATQNVAQDTKEIATETQEAQNAVEKTVEARKEEAKVIEEPIEDLKTLEEYQQKYKKAPRGMTDETYDTDSNLKVYHPNFSTESIGHLESMMEMFYTKDGGVMPSYKGMALPKEVVESLGADKLNSLLAEYAIRFHKEFEKYVQDSYMRMSHAKDLAEKGESIEDDHYFQKMTKAMEEFKAKLVNDAMKLIEAISKSEESVFVSNDKYDDLSDYWLMEGGKGHDVAMSDTDVWSNVVSQTEYLADQEKELQTVLQIQASKKQIAETTKQEKQDAQDIVNIKQKEAKVTNDVKQEVQDIVNIKQEEAKATNNVKQEVEEVKQEVETTGAKWKETYVHLLRVVEASDEFKKANLGALEAWDEIKASTESYELDEQWKEAVDAIKEFAEEMEIVIEDEEKLYQQRQQENAKTSLADTKVGEKKAADGKKLDKNGVEKDTKAKNENTKATNKNTEATNKNNKAKQENAKATNKTADATKKSTKAKKDSTQATKEMITIEKDATKDDYRKAALEAITKVGKSNTFKKYSKDDEALKKAFADLETEAKVNKSSSAGIDYWEGLIKRLRDIATKGHVQSSTIDNALIPYIGGTVQKSKASKQVKEMAEGKPSDTNKTVDDAKKIETSTVNTAKAQNDVAKATKVVKVDTNEVAKSTDVVKQNIAETTESMDDLKDIIVSDADINALFDGADESDEAKLNKLREQAIQAAEANKDYAKQLEEQEKSENKKASSSKKVVETKKEENKVEQQILETKEEEQNVVDDIADTQKEVVIITQQANEIDQEKLQAMKDELNAKEKLGAEQKVQLQTLKNEIKEGEKKERAINKSIEQENKMIGKMQEKIAIAQDAEETSKRENEERIKQRTELEAHIKLLEQQADEKRQAIALLESEVEYTEDNSFQIKQLTKEYDKLQENISETQAKVDELTDSYYEQQEQARKANNEASQQMIDEYMKRIEKEDEIRRKESAKYLPARSGEVGEYKGGGGGGNVPPSGGSDESSINAELSDRIKLRQRELMLQLQQVVYNKDLSDEQKMGVQILAEQILEIGQLASSMKDLNWLTQNVKENMKEFKFSVKVDEDNKKELAKIAEEERKELTNMYASLFDEIDANEKLKAEKQSLEELIALYKEKTLAQVDEYSVKNSGYVDQDRISDLRSMVQYMEKNISSAGEYEQVIRQIGNAFREIKFDTNQTKQWYKMEESAEKARVAKEKEAKAQEELNRKVQEHIKIKKEQAQLYAKEILSSSTMRKATEEERQEMERLITQYNITGSSVKEVNQSYAEMQRTVKNMRLDIMNKQLMEQDTWLDKVKNGIKDYVRFTLDLDDIQGVMQNITRVFQSSFEHIKVLDEAYTNINQTMDVSIEEFDVMAQKAYEVGDASGALGTDILEMMKIYANANETVESLNAKVAGTTAFQNVSGLSGTDATNALQTIINQFKLTTEEGYSAGDAITYVGDAITGVAYNLSKDEGDAMREIISAVEDAGSVIKTAGGSLEWYAAVTGTLAETVNATGSEVGGAMRMITARTLQQKEAFDELNDSGEETEVAMANAEKALSGLGISIRESDGDLRSIEEVLGDVASKWQTLSDSDQQFVAEKLAGTNRRSYFMALMENYKRVQDLQGEAMASEGMMMEASEKYAESLTGKLNQLTNAKEKFYQTILNSDALKVGTQGLTDLLNSVTKVVEYMDGKWVTAIGGATGALIAFKMAKDGLTFGDFIKGLGTTILKFAGLEAGAITATGALTALKSVLLGIAGGAVLAVITGGIVALVNSMKSAEEQVEETRVALENYKATMADVENDSASVQGMQMKIDKMKELNTTLDDQVRLASEVNDELASHADSYGSIEHILRNENLALQDRLDLLDREIEKRGEIARQAALEALNGKDMFGFGDNVYDNLIEDLDPTMGQFLNAQNGINKASMGGLFAPSTEQIDSYYELWEDAESRLQAIYEQGAEQYSLAQEYFKEGIINEEDMAQQTELYEQFVDDLLFQVQRVSEETGSSIALDIFDFEDPLNPTADPTQSIQEQNAYYVEQVELLETLKGLYNDVQDGMSGTELSNIFNSDVMKDFTGDITKTEDVMAHLGQKIAETENEIDALGATSHSVFNEQEKDVAELQKEYIDACKTIEDIEGYMEQIGEEGGVSADMMSTLFDSGLLEGYTGSLTDAGAIQEHLTSKIAESEAVARQAYLNMMKDDADFWAQKMANSEEWRDHENTVQQDIIGIMANSLGVQAEDFSSFIDSKGGMREVDYTNASTMAEAENTMQSSLATQVLGYAAQLINSKAGYRQTDMGNVNEFLNSQGVAEAQTVQELASMWADFYNAKVAAINNTMSEINSQIAAGWTNDQIEAMDGWFGDGSLRAKQTELNKLQNQIKSLAATNLTMTNFFAGLDTYFSGVGGGVGQSTVGGGRIGGGGGGNSWKPTSTGGSGYKPSGGSGGKGGGSGSKPSSGKGGSGSGGSGSSKQEVEDMEAEIDRYYELNDAINDNEKAISQLQSKRDSITTKSAYKKSIEQEVALLNKQIQAYKNLQKEQQKERNEIKKTLSKNGFKFDKNGDISNYAKQVKKLQDQANKKTGTKKEQAIENVKYLIDLIERYDELNSEAIPETTLEILDLKNEIQELNKDLAENMKNIEKLGDRYFRVTQAMNDVTDALEMNRAKQEHADEEEKIKLMEQEIDLMKQQQKINRDNKKVAEEEAKQLRKQLEESGVKFNKDGNISNYEVLIEKMEKDANKLVGQAQEDAVTEIEDLLELIEKYVALTDDTIPELDQSWQEYANSIKDVEKELEDMYREHQETAVQTQKDIASAYEHYLTKRYDKLKESLNKERDLYNDSYDAENFQSELDEQQRTLDEIAQQIAVYERDTSLAGQAKLAQLKEEYEAQRKAINDMVRENEHNKTNEDFDKQEKALDDALEEALDPAKLVKVVNDAIGSGLITIGDQVMELDDLMTTWLDETGDGLYALGDKLKSELLDNLENAHKILGDMNMFNTNGSVSFVSSNALLAKQNPSTVSSSSSNPTISFDAPLLYVSGNVDSSNIDEITNTLKDMEQRIYTTIANALK